MKTLPKIVALLASAAAAPAMAAGFTGVAAPANFAVANTGTLIGGSPVVGTAVFSPTELTLTSSDTVSPDPPNFAPGCAGGAFGDMASPCQIQAVLGHAGTYSFDWTYVTSDPTGPGGDIFGVVVDGVRTPLSDVGGPPAQSGAGASFIATSSFGWFLNCTDCIEGSATATVSNFSTTAVPEPASYALLLAGGAAIAWARRRPSARRR